MHYHYYPYGLKIATLSAKKLPDLYEGVVKNNYLYQGAFAELDEDIQWTDFPLRNYDAQTGRWVQQDPYQQFASPYIGMGDDPVNNIDPSGGIVPGGISGLSTTAEKAITLGEVVVTSTSKALSIANKGLSLTSSLSLLVRTVSSASNILNSNIASLQVGRPPYEYDQYGNKISNLGGDKIDFYHQKNGDTKVVDRESCASNIITRGEKLIRDYSHRDKNIGWDDIFKEFKKGTGPIKSLISDFDDSKIGAFGSLDNAFSTYASKARESLLESSSPRGLTKFDYAETNPVFAEDMWEQMWGRTNVSWYKLGEKVLYLMADSKSMESFFYRNAKSHERSQQKEYGNTYQTYIWTESMNEIKSKQNEVDKYFERILRESRNQKF